MFIELIFVVFDYVMYLLSFTGKLVMAKRNNLYIDIRGWRGGGDGGRRDIRLPRRFADPNFVTNLNVAEKCT